MPRIYVRLKVAPRRRTAFGAPQRTMGGAIVLLLIRRRAAVGATSPMPVGRFFSNRRLRPCCQRGRTLLLWSLAARAAGRPRSVLGMSFEVVSTGSLGFPSKFLSISLYCVRFALFIAQSSS